MYYNNCYTSFFWEQKWLTLNVFSPYPNRAIFTINPRNIYKHAPIHFGLNFVICLMNTIVFGWKYLEPLKKEVYKPLLVFQNLKFVEFLNNNVCGYNTYKMFRNYLDPFKRNEHHFNEKNRNNHVKD